MSDKIRAATPAVITYAEAHGVNLATVAGTGAGGRVTLEDVRAATPEPSVTPLLARMAAQYGVDLREVTGTGVAGRIRKSDVQAAAGVPTTPSAAEFDELERVAPGLRADLAAGAAARASQLQREAAARGPAYALNPGVSCVYAEVAAGRASAPTTTAPTLFPGGRDLPAFTASGVRPETLLQVPWNARHALAAAPTTADAYKIVSDCTEGVDGADGETIARVDYGDHPGNAAYAVRVQKWQMDSITEEQWDAADPVLAAMCDRAEKEIADVNAQARKRLGL